MGVRAGGRGGRREEGAEGGADGVRVDSERESGAGGRGGRERAASAFHFTYYPFLVQRVFSPTSYWPGESLA